MGWDGKQPRIPREQREGVGGGRGNHVIITLVDLSFSCAPNCGVCRIEAAAAAAAAAAGQQGKE